MNTSLRWSLSEMEQTRLVQTLTTNLPLLRKKMDITQEELAEIVGISRQTFSAIENGKRAMSWQTYLSLVLFFDANKTTHDLLRHFECFPDMLIDKTVGEEMMVDLDNGNSHSEILHMLSKLDEQGVRTVKTVLMVEFARCSKISGEAVVKAFDGSGFADPSTSNDNELNQALKRIKMRSVNNEN